MNDAVRQHGGEIGYFTATSAVLGEQFADAVERYENATRTNPRDCVMALSSAYGELTAIAAMGIAALERAELKSTDPADTLAREDALLDSLRNG